VPVPSFAVLELGPVESPGLESLARSPQPLRASPSASPNDAVGATIARRRAPQNGHPDASGNTWRAHDGQTCIAPRYARAVAPRKHRLGRSRALATRPGCVMDSQMSMAVSMTALERLPVLPVSSVVLVPGMVLPLNVIHPAERELVDFIREHDLQLGVPLLRPRERDAGGKPAFEVVFGLGRMMRHTPLDDERRVIRLEGVGRVRMLHEHPPRRRFREVAAAPLLEPGPPAAAGLAVLRAQLERIAGHASTHQHALAPVLAISTATAFLDAVTIGLPYLELLGRERRFMLEGFTDRTTQLQQQSLAAESADRRVMLLCGRVSAALARLRDRSPPRLTH